jgi:formylglycine-generating enzyme required for sulfatase activity
LTEEAKKRKQAEERARQMAEAALKAQQRAEIEHENAEKEIQQRQLEEGTRRKAEQAALKLAAEVAEAKRKYEEAKREAEAEAHFRAEAELKQKEIEAEVERIARLEAEKRRIAEAQAAEQIKQQESLLKQQALEAQQKTEEARRLAESEAEKRQQAEAARIKAEEEARRLAEEIIKAQQQLEEAQRFAKSESEKRAVEKAARIKAEESARSLSALRESAGNFDKKHSSEISVENAVNDLAPVSRGETVAISSKPSLGRMLLNTSSSDVSNTNQIPRNKIFNPLILAAGAFALFLVSGFGGFLIYQLTKSSNIESASVNSNIAVSPTQTTPQLPARVRGKMVLIEGGTFLMGNNDVDLENYVFNNQYPAHTVKVPDFYIDITEVTNEEYNEFVQSGNKPPRNWQDGKPPTGQEKFPVTNISYLEAEKFADWISKRNNIICRLPAEEEWEYAARSGKEQNTYPWGKDWDPGRVNINSKTPREVGTTGDETNIGKVKDMMGNVVEWTSTAYNFYENFPKYKAYPFDPKKFTVRGASFASSPDQIKNHRFLLTFRQGVEDTNASPTLGFRLACYP